MSLKRDLHHNTGPSAAKNVIHVGELMKQIELMSGIRKRIRDGYYDRPDVLFQIADQLRHRLSS
jgi:hypothetical protein